MKRDKEFLQAALDFSRERSGMLTAHLIKARSQLAPIETRKLHLERAIADARAILDELVTKQVALGWRKGA